MRLRSTWSAARPPRRLAQSAGGSFGFDVAPAGIVAKSSIWFSACFESRIGTVSIQYNDGATRESTSRRDTARPTQSGGIQNERPPSDTAEHGEDFSRRYAEDLEIVAGQAMMDLGIAERQMGQRDHARASKTYSFFAGDRQGGTVSHAGQVTLDSGLMNPDLLKDGYDQEAQRAWRRARIGNLAQAIIAHEIAEHEYDGDHELALIAGSETKLAISSEESELLKKMEAGWRGD